MKFTEAEVDLLRAALMHLRSWQQAAFGQGTEEVAGLLEKLNAPASEPAPAKKKK